MNPWWPTPPVPLILLTVFSHSLYPCVVWESCLYHMETSNKLYNVPVYYVCLLYLFIISILISSVSSGVQIFILFTEIYQELTKMSGT